MNDGRVMATDLRAENKNKNEEVTDQSCGGGGGGGIIDVHCGGGRPLASLSFHLSEQLLNYIGDATLQHGTSPW